MTFTRQFLLSPTAGRRPRVPGAVVIIADEKSSDNITVPASVVKASGSLTQTVLRALNIQAHIQQLHISTNGIFYSKF